MVRDARALSAAAVISHAGCGGTWRAGHRGAASREPGSPPTWRGPQGPALATSLASALHNGACPHPVCLALGPQPPRGPLASATTWPSPNRWGGVGWGRVGPAGDLRRPDPFLVLRWREGPVRWSEAEGGDSAAPWAGPACPGNSQPRLWADGCLRALGGAPELAHPETQCLGTCSPW